MASCSLRKDRAKRGEGKAPPQRGALAEAGWAAYGELGRSTQGREWERGFVGPHVRHRVDAGKR